MTTPPADPGYRRDHGCETPGCPNDFAIVSVQVDSSEVNMRCQACEIAFWMAVLQRMTETGMLIADEPGGGAPAPPPPTGVV